MDRTTVKGTVLVRLKADATYAGAGPDCERAVV